MVALCCFFLICGWEAQTSGVAVNLYDVDCVNENQCWVVGEAGTILYTSDAGYTWQQQTSNTTEDLFGIDFIDAVNGWAAGFGPTILHTTDGGAVWTPQTPGTSNDLLDIAFASSTRGWATGVTGTIVGTSDGGASWSSEISGQWAWLWGVSAFSPTAAWAFGADWFNNIAPIYHYDGTNWESQSEVTATKDGKAIACADNNTVWAVGGNGTIMYSSDGGGTWDGQASGTTNTLFSVSPASVTSCWIAGASGIILTTADSGTNWDTQSSSVSDSLFGVSMRDGLVGWIVGENGVILHTTDGGSGVSEDRGFSRNSPIALYPNPARHTIQVVLSELSAPSIRITLFDASGREYGILYQGAAGTRIGIRLPVLPAGVYFMHFEADGEKAVRRFVVVD